MKTSAVAPAGLLSVVLMLSAMGCKITHYGTPGAPVDPGGEARCKATCDRLIEDEAIPRSAAKACLSVCQSPAAAAPAKTADVRVAEKTRPSVAEDRVEDPAPDRQEVSCQCKKGKRCESCHRPLPATPECQSDSDCPEDTACESGTCK